LSAVLVFDALQIITKFGLIAPEMRALDELLPDTAPPGVFHPIRESPADAWFPGNEAASLAVQCSHIWEDILCLTKVRAVTSDKYAGQLLLKHVVVELRSLLEVFDRLQSHVMRADVCEPGASNPWRGLTSEEHARARALYKEYAGAKRQTERSIIDIRDNIGAHRGNLNWQQVQLFWSLVTVETIAPLLEVVPRVFELVKDLNIYEWNRSFPDGSIAILGSRIHPESFQDEA
jgi:hypothetical protein